MVQNAGRNPTVQKKAAQEAYLVTYEATGGDITRACQVAKRTRRAIDNWMRTDLDFRQKFEMIKRRLIETAGEKAYYEVAGTGKGGRPPKARPGIAVWDEGFGSFQRKFMKREPTRFHMEIIEAYENTRPGNMLMVLVPPEHGKTTLFEDFASFKLATDKTIRFTVGAEKINLSSRILRRIQLRMDPEGPYPEYVQWFGPLHPKDGRIESRASEQVWSAKHFDVCGKTADDERDYSMQALGIGAQVAGTRTDWLHVDDITSLNNYNQTLTAGGLVDTYRQDWLSRPGEHGRSTINGTRVGELDFYEVLEEEIPDDILKIIRYPALVWNTDLGEFVPLWAERYTLENLERMRAKVGEEAWWRNYMQQPRAKGSATFTPELVEPCKDETLNVETYKVPYGDHFILSLDPSIGNHNVFMAIHLKDDEMIPFWVDDSVGLGSYDDIFAIAHRLLSEITHTGAICSGLIVEATHFQSGLLDTMAMKELQARFGFFPVHPHMTNRNKTDPIIGIPAMPSTFRRREIRIPWGGQLSRDMMGNLCQQLYRWRAVNKLGKPVRGTDLQQDQVMTLWFAHKWWQEQRERFGVPQVYEPPHQREILFPKTAMPKNLPSGYKRSA